MFSTIQLTEKSFQKPLCVCRQFPVCAKVSKCLLILDPRVVSSVLPLWLISCLLAVVEHNVIVTKTSAVQTQTRNTGALFSYAGCLDRTTFRRLHATCVTSSAFFFLRWSLLAFPCQATAAPSAVPLYRLPGDCRKPYAVQICLYVVHCSRWQLTLQLKGQLPKPTNWPVC